VYSEVLLGLVHYLCFCLHDCGQSYDDEFVNNFVAHRILTVDDVGHHGAQLS
jgi:hypothetical protein